MGSEFSRLFFFGGGRGGGGELSGFKKVDSYRETTRAGDRVIVISYNACIRFVVLACVRFFFETRSRPLTTESFDCDRIERRDNSIIFCNYIYKAPSSIVSRKTALPTKHLSSSSVISPS